MLNVRLGHSNSSGPQWLPQQEMKVSIRWEIPLLSPVQWPPSPLEQNPGVFPSQVLADLWSFLLHSVEATLDLLQFLQPDPSAVSRRTLHWLQIARPSLHLGPAEISSRRCLLCPPELTQHLCLPLSAPHPSIPPLQCYLTISCVYVFPSLINASAPRGQELGLTRGRRCCGCPVCLLCPARVGAQQAGLQCPHLHFFA